MRTGYTQIDEWPVRPYSKRELAMAYAPEISPVSALNRLGSSLRGDTATRRYRRAAMPVLASDNASTGVGLRR